MKSCAQWSVVPHAKQKAPEVECPDSKGAPAACYSCKHKCRCAIEKLEGDKWFDGYLELDDDEKGENM